MEVDRVPKGKAKGKGGKDKGGKGKSKGKRQRWQAAKRQRQRWRFQWQERPSVCAITASDLGTLRRIAGLSRSMARVVSTRCRRSVQPTVQVRPHRRVLLRPPTVRRVQVFDLSDTSS